MKGTPSQARARALALAAVRETFEEAGLLIGTPLAAPVAARRRPGRTSSPHGFRPALAAADVLCARHHAARPAAPLRHALLLRRRPKPSSTGSTIADGELSDLEWHSIAQARALELPNITRVVLEDLGERIAAGALHTADFPVPFYHRRNGSFRRDLISADADLD